MAELASQELEAIKARHVARVVRSAGNVITGTECQICCQELPCDCLAVAASLGAALVRIEDLEKVVAAARAVHKSRVIGAVNLRAFSTVGSIEMGALDGALAALGGEDG